jgi:electron transfer flavoprotein beta subunit
VKKIVEINKDQGYAIVHRKLEDGYEVVQSTLPCLFSVEKEINEVPYSPLPNLIKAARYQPHIWAVNDLEDVDRSQLGLKGSPTIVSSVWAPQKPQGGTMLEGGPQEQAAQLLDILLQKKELFQARGGTA